MAAICPGRRKPLVSSWLAAQEADDVTGAESLEKLCAKLDKERKMESVIPVDIRLSFEYDDPQYKEVTEEEYNKKRGLEFMVHESDALTKKLGDRHSSTYDRLSVKFAQIMEKYIKVSKNYDKLIQDPTKEESYGKALERYMGSYLVAVDVFLVKVVEKIRGVAERDKLVTALKGQGFDAGEGFDVEIDTIPGRDEPQVRLKYEKKMMKATNFSALMR